MIALSVPQRMPSRVAIYLLLSSVFCIASMVLGYSLIYREVFTIHFPGQEFTLSLVWPGRLLFLLGFLFLVRKYVWYFTFSFTFDEHSMSTRYGLLSRTSKTFDLNKIQNIDVHQNLLQQAFQLASVSIATSSPDQVVTYGRGRSVFIPSAFMYLFLDDARELAEKAIHTGAVQKVEIIN